MTHSQKLRVARRRFAGGALIALGLLTLAVWRMPEIAAWQWRFRAGKPAFTTSVITLAAPLRWFDDYFAVADLGNSTYVISEPRYWQCNFSYLIVGSRRALLFDSGPGIRDIRSVVLSLTQLPVEALPSHLHFDHVGNLNRFTDVALPDLPGLRRQVRNGSFQFGYYQFLGFVEGFPRPTLSVSEWVKLDTEIDLGDRRLTLLSVPGHTPDSVALLDRNANRLFAGDFIYPSDVYAFLPGANLRDYATSAERLAGFTDEATRIYGAHGCESLPNVEVPLLHYSDLLALARALKVANTSWARAGWYPRRIPVNDRMTLLAKYPWMKP
jgi:glyoxylase-like metal-dependent hydrolase (beta-lactamase superfamily II)